MHCLFCTTCIKCNVACKQQFSVVIIESDYYYLGGRLKSLLNVMCLMSNTYNKSINLTKIITKPMCPKQDQ